MSAVEKNTWPADPGDAVAHPESTAEDTKPTATKPALVAPPARPVRPSPPPKPSATPPGATQAPTPATSAPVASVPVAAPEPTVDPEAYRHLPIAPPSEPMQYRAIGLVRGTYLPTEADQINRGNLTTEDGVVVDAVLLGRVTSLVKKHLELTVPHLWVVYPRTRRETEAGDEQDLHFQIVGVWEPETLGLPGEAPKAGQVVDATDGASDPNAPTPAVEPPQEEPSKARKAKRTKVSQEEPPAASADPQASAPTCPDVDDNYFSIRGEVVNHEPEKALITVKILQGVKQTPGGAKSFKLCLQGHIEGRVVGYFWDFQVKRNAKVLTVETASRVGIVPPKKRPKGGGNRRPPGIRPSGPRSSAPPHKTASAHSAPRPKKVVGSDSSNSRQESPE